MLRDRDREKSIWFPRMINNYLKKGRKRRGEGEGGEGGGREERGGYVWQRVARDNRIWKFFVGRRGASTRGFWWTSSISDATSNVLFLLYLQGLSSPRSVAGVGLTDGRSSNRNGGCQLTNDTTHDCRRASSNTRSKLSLSPLRCSTMPTHYSTPPTGAKKELLQSTNTGRYLQYS